LERENSFNTNAERNFTNGEVRSVTTTFHFHDDTFKNLGTFFFTFFNFDTETAMVSPGENAGCFFVANPAMKFLAFIIISFTSKRHDVAAKY
jgi:hypothetical protein